VKKGSLFVPRCVFSFSMRLNGCQRQHPNPQNFICQHFDLSSLLNPCFPRCIWMFNFSLISLVSTAISFRFSTKFTAFRKSINMEWMFELWTACLLKCYAYKAMSYLLFLLYVSINLSWPLCSSLILAGVASRSSSMKILLVSAINVGCQSKWTVLSYFVWPGLVVLSSSSRWWCSGFAKVNLFSFMNASEL